MYTLLIIGLFFLLLLVFHMVGIRTKGKISRKIWKSGDYIWLSMAIFALIGGGYEFRKAISNDVIQSTNVILIDALKERELTVQSATNELINFINQKDLSKYDHSRLDQITKKSVVLDKSLVKNFKLQYEAEQSLNKSLFERAMVYLYPFVLAFALALRFTLASADIFDWYAKPSLSNKTSNEQDPFTELTIATDDIPSEGTRPVTDKEYSSAQTVNESQVTPDSVKP